MAPRRSKFPRGCFRAARPAGPGAARRGFTLIELMFIMALLGILAALVVPHYVNVSDQANDVSIRRHLQIIRQQIQYYALKNLRDPDLIGRQWDDLVQGDYLHSVPVNPANHSKLIAAAAAAGVGWVWRDNGYGVHMLYGTDKLYNEMPD